ncbi:uncharacterized protein MONBRDRAFT_3220, partial [Monosiga brevicollis MX1]
LQTKRVINMTRGGRQSSMWALVIVGNKKGVAGFAIAKAEDVGDAVRKATAKAIRKAVFIDRFDERTIHHTIHHKFLRTKIFLRPKRPGGGLIAHRSVMGIAELAGIRDLGADIIGSNNPLNVVRATFGALARQIPATELAEARG